jgi:hypothetical protein
MQIEINDCDDWTSRGITVEEGDDKILWTCPFYSNSWIPPKDHWEAVHEQASGTPKIEYC